MKISAYLIVVLSGLFALIFGLLSWLTATPLVVLTRFSDTRLAFLPKLGREIRKALVLPGQEVKLGWSPTALAIIFALMGVGFLIVWLIRKRSLAFSALAVGVIAADIVIITGFAPTAARFVSEPSRCLSRQAADMIGENGAIIAYDWKSSNLVFYSGRRIDYVGKDQTEALNQSMETPVRMVILTKADRATPGKFPGFEIFSRKGKYVLMARR